MLFFFWPTFLALYIKDPPDVIYNITIYADDTTLYSKCDQASYLWQQLEFASKHESQFVSILFSMLESFLTSLKTMVLLM